jgi:hypothetical protein
MMALNQEAAHHGNQQACATNGQPKMTIDLPAACVLKDSGLIDLMIALAFSRLGEIEVEMRVLETPATKES